MANVDILFIVTALAIGIVTSIIGTLIAALLFPQPRDILASLWRKLLRLPRRVYFFISKRAVNEALHIQRLSFAWYCIRQSGNLNSEVHAQLIDADTTNLMAMTELVRHTSQAEGSRQTYNDLTRRLHENDLPSVIEDQTEIKRYRWVPADETGITGRLEEVQS